MKKIITLIVLTIVSFQLEAKTLTVGNDGDGYQYSEIQQAAKDAVPGDTILVFEGEYAGGQYIENLKGTADQAICLMAYSNDVVFKGGNQAWHLINPEYLQISGFTFEGQTVNGVNIDDGGDYSTPARGILIEDCTWRDMNASGNNDMLKLSGLDDFQIRNCAFENGSTGGSLIDMVGCHRGLIWKNHFENGGSNSIQAKGGSAELIVAYNIFLSGGERGINIGGSTGEDFFRPPDADYESRQIVVFANIFFGSQAPIAYVGTVESTVVHNTIVNPNKWAIRILQENTEKVQCANNVFANNIVYLGDIASSPTLNIGPNTQPETFAFMNNLWYNYDDFTWTGPNLPVQETNGIIEEDPLFMNMGTGDMTLESGSPAIGKGINLGFANQNELFERDFDDNYYNDPPSIGAIEGNPPDNSVDELNKGNNPVRIFPNPCSVYARLQINLNEASEYDLYIIDINGNKLSAQQGIILESGEQEINLAPYIGELSNGTYFIYLKGWKSCVSILNICR